MTLRVRRLPHLEGPDQRQRSSEPKNCYRSTAEQRRKTNRVQASETIGGSRRHRQRPDAKPQCRAASMSDVLQSPEL